MVRRTCSAREEEIYNKGWGKRKNQEITGQNIYKNSDKKEIIANDKERDIPY